MSHGGATTLLATTGEPGSQVGKVEIVKLWQAGYVQAKPACRGSKDAHKDSLVVDKNDTDNV